MSGGRKAEAAAEIPRFVSRSHRSGAARALGRVDPGDRNDPGDHGAEPEDGPSLLRLPLPVQAAVRRMGAAMGLVGPAEVVRRGLILLDFALSLGRDEELVVRNRVTGRCDRLEFSWDVAGSAPDDRRPRRSRS
jgi:hypothetical protein